jgi:uncharacterized protein (TIGR02271 family)
LHTGTLAELTFMSDQRKDCDDLRIPILKEDLEIEKRVIETGKVLLEKRVREKPIDIEERLTRDTFEIERITLNQPISEPPEPHWEGDTLVLPIVEEQLVVEKRLVLKEELRVTPRHEERDDKRTVMLREETVSVLREEPKEQEEQNMERVVIGMYDDHSVAKRVASELERAGCDDDDIKVVAGKDDKSGPLDFLKRVFGLERRTYEPYAEGMRRGCSVVSVRTTPATEDQVLAIMEQYNPIDLDTRMEEWRASGWKHDAVETREVDAREAGSAIPVIEEELQVGKREVKRGGVRVYTRVDEKPVEETVRLREEKVHVERHPVDREVNAADVEAFREGVVELTETAEEPVVRKQARVVEEVVVGKDVRERTETIRDKIKKTDVKVEQIAGERRGVDLGASNVDEDAFRDYYSTHYPGQEDAYDSYRRAYTYGNRLASDERYRSVNDWTLMEADARTDWDRESPGTWERFKDAIRYGWERARGGLRDAFTDDERDRVI